MTKAFGLPFLFTIITYTSVFKQNFDGSQKEGKSYGSMVWQKGEGEEKQQQRGRCINDWSFWVAFAFSRLEILFEHIHKWYNSILHCTIEQCTDCSNG